MKNIDTTIKLIPNLIDEILMYFAYELRPDSHKDIMKKTIGGLEVHLAKKYNLDNISRASDLIYICNALCNQSIGFVCLKRDNSLGYQNVYYWAGAFSDGSYFQNMACEERKELCRILENSIYGFKYIYEQCKDFVIPILHVNQNGEEGIGTGFIWGNNYIVTAKHCIENSQSIAFGKIDYNIYKDAKVYYHNNNYVDIALIKLSPLEYDGFNLVDKVSLFETVITMGYPKIPGFTCFQTAEKATVSALPEKRLTVTEGEIASEAQEIWSKENLFLVTAKIKGGNSGGPLINIYGNCIGIVSAIPFSKGDLYDDLGYGTVIPAKLALEMEKDLSQHQCIDNIKFTPYPY